MILFLIFISGFLAGILISLLNMCALLFFRRNVERKLMVIERQIEEAGPKPKGYIFEPEDEAAEAREKIIARNRREGRDTHIEELL